MHIRVNESVVDVPGGVATWGDLLNWLETDYLKSGQCITRVSIGENEALRYRDDNLCGQDLTGLEPIDIESGDFDSVVRQSLEELDAELSRVMDAGREVIELFEARDHEKAYNILAQYLESIAVLFAIFAEDLGWIHEEQGRSRAELVTALEQALAQLISAQENGLWIAICDVLEYEISPVLESWKGLVQRTRAQIN